MCPNLLLEQSVLDMLESCSQFESRPEVPLVCIPSIMCFGHVLQYWPAVYATAVSKAQIKKKALCNASVPFFPWVWKIAPIWAKIWMGWEEGDRGGTVKGGTGTNGRCWPACALLFRRSPALAWALPWHRGHGCQACSQPHGVKWALLGRGGCGLVIVMRDPNARGRNTFASRHLAGLLKDSFCRTILCHISKQYNVSCWFVGFSFFYIVICI